MSELHILNTRDQIKHSYALLKSFSIEHIKSSDVLFEKDVGLKRFHFEVVCLKILINSLPNKDDIIQDYSIHIAALAHILRGDSFSAMQISRPAMELLPQILLKLRDQTPTQSFSNNLEKLLSLLKKDYINVLSIRRKKDRDEFSNLTNKFCSASKEIYWDISDYTHVSNHELLTDIEVLDSLIIDHKLSETDLNNCKKTIGTLTKVATFCKELLSLNSLVLTENIISPELLHFLLENPTEEYQNIQKYIFLK